jgi:peptide/nickel transport system permease protein
MSTTAGEELMIFYRSYFKLDRPIWEQYATFLRNMLRGDLGKSIGKYPWTVGEMLGETLPWTLQLVIPATLIAAVVGSVIGSLFAWPRMPRAYNAVIPGLVFFSAIPGFVLAIALITIFSFYLRLLPAGGAWDMMFVPARVPISERAYLPDYTHWPTVKQIIMHSILPLASLVLVGLAPWALSMRGMTVTVQGEDYMLFAEAKGLTNRRLFSYTVRNTLLPQITRLGLAFSTVLTGGILVENVFVYPGVGQVINGGIARKDFPVIYVTSLILIVMLCGLMFLLDVLYPLMDPRISLEGRR